MTVGVEVVLRIGCSLLFTQHSFSANVFLCHQINALLVPHLTPCLVHRHRPHLISQGVYVWRLTITDAVIRGLSGHRIVESMR
jgi:hypothetical protein